MKYMMLVLLSLTVFSSSLSADVFLDFDGDGKTDPTVLRSTVGKNNITQFHWFVLENSGGYFSVPWGGGDLRPGGYSDFLVPGDYDGDGKTDFAVWRRPVDAGQQCHFYILYSSTSTFDVIPWGVSPSVSFVDEQIPQDYDGDGKSDIAIVRSNSAGLFFWIFQSTDGVVRVERFGLSGDVVARGDFDGDGKADLAVARRRDQSIDAVYDFYIKNSSNEAVWTKTLGIYANDVLAPGDFDGDGKTDIAVVGRRGKFPTYIWKWFRSSDGGLQSIKFGKTLDYAVAGDYDGDGKTDVAIYRQSLNCANPGYFWINGSLSGLDVKQFGTCHGGIELY